MYRLCVPCAAGLGVSLVSASFASDNVAGRTQQVGGRGRPPHVSLEGGWAYVMLGGIDPLAYPAYHRSPRSLELPR